MVDRETILERVSPEASIEAIPLHGPEVPRTEYRRPKEIRSGYWMSLNGPWAYLPDNNFAGRAEDYSRQRLPTDKTIIVPWPPTHSLSGVFDGNYEQITHIWEQKEVPLNPDVLENKLVLLHFDSVNYLSRVFLNGCMVKEHIGRTGFQALVDPGLWQRKEPNLLTVESYNNPLEDDHGHAKESEEVHPVTCLGPWEPGIRKPVWEEFVNERHMKGVRLIPDYRTGEITFDIPTYGKTDGSPVIIRVSYRDEEILTTRTEIKSNGHSRGILKLRDFNPWSPEEPNLYDIRVILGKEENPSDIISACTGFSHIEARGDKIFLNGKEFYVRGILWHLSNPADAREWEGVIDFVKNKIGFNTLSMHMDEDPVIRYLMARNGVVGMQSGWNWGLNMRDPEKWRGEVGRWGRFLGSNNWEPETKFFAPIVEGWFLNDLKYPERSCDPRLIQLMYQATKAQATNSLIFCGDGWAKKREPDGTIYDSDGSGLHHYPYEQQGDLARAVAANIGLQHGEKIVPTVVTEYGGIGLDCDPNGRVHGEVYDAGRNRFSYIQKNTPEEVLEIIDAQTAEIDQTIGVAGRVYTQLDDYNYEDNGLRANESPKYDPDRLKVIFSDRRK